MKKVTGILFAASVLCFWVVASLVIAAPPGSQPPSNQLPIVFPDVRMYQVRTEVIHLDGTYSLTPSAVGDRVKIICEFKVCGCTQTGMLWVRADIDNAVFYEEEVSCIPVSNYPPRCTLGTYVACRDNRIPVGEWTTTAGFHTIKCILDSKNVIGEGPQHELNNTKSIQINLPSPAIDKIRDMKTKAPIPVPVPGTR